MPQQLLTPQLASELASKILTQQLTKLDIERHKFGKNKGKIIARWEEGATGSIPGETFTADILREIAGDLEQPKISIVTLSVKRTENEYVATYAAAKEKTNADQ